MRASPMADPDPSPVSRAAARLREATRVLVLTGAGISAESGVPTFRGPHGLWCEFRPEDLATADAFAHDPRLVWEWYDWRRQQVAQARPNAAHQALVELEALVPEILVVTQNVDGLHAAAGSRRLVELHGSLWRVRCVACGEEAEDRRTPLPELPPHCACGGRQRPGVVWFGEALPQQALFESLAAAQRAEVVIVIGTSSVVYPAAALPQAAKSAGGFVIEVNPEATSLTPIADVSLRGTAVGIVPRLVRGDA
jgi:NAD-dependent deacetylase